ncbi:IS66 family transposase [Mesorhizobium caraganae]|uniref:IS66 family transposase n=1 Tax=Mesorhizobium caraganae TaxID=483206 RepID=UPI0035E4029D
MSRSVWSAGTAIRPYRVRCRLCRSSGRVWVYVFDGSGYQDPTPGAIAYYYSPDRKGTHPADHLANFSGVMSCRWLWGLQEALRQPDRRGRMHGACAPQVP